MLCKCRRGRRSQRIQEFGTSKSFMPKWQQISDPGTLGSRDGSSAPPVAITNSIFEQLVDAAHRGMGDAAEPSPANVEGSFAMEPPASNGRRRIIKIGPNSSVSLERRVTDDRVTFRPRRGALLLWRRYCRELHAAIFAVEVAHEVHGAV